MATSINSIIRDVNRENTIWYLWDLYDASPSARYPNGRFVPKVYDRVIDFDNGSLEYTVSSVMDVPPYTFTLVAAEKAESGNSQDSNLLRGYGPLVISEADVIYVDKTVSPNTMIIGNNAHTYSSIATYCTVFRRTNGADDEILSGYMDDNGNLTSPRIPLVASQTTYPNNLTVKVPAVAYCIQPVNHGETVYVVVYNSFGKTLAVNHYLISESSTIHEPTMTYKSIKGIELTTPFISDTEPTVIEADLNLPVDDLSLRCKITYMDGTSRLVDIDGTKTIVDGLGSYVATQLGQEKSLMLYYNLSNDEVSTDLANGYTKTIPKKYRIRTVEVPNSYFVKLFVVPRWISDVYGYRLEYYLYDLNRKSVTDVTSLVSYNTTSQAFDGIAYNMVQRLSIALELKDVSSSYKNGYRHTQLLNLTLVKKGSTGGLQTAYHIAYNIDSDEYGDNIYAVRKTVNTDYFYDISCGIGLLDDWLEECYYKSYPLYSPTSGAELRGPKPTHVRAILHNQVSMISVVNFKELQSLGTKDKSVVGDTITLQWVRIIESVVSELATTSMLVETS